MPQSPEIYLCSDFPLPKKRECETAKNNVSAGTAVVIAATTTGVPSENEGSLPQQKG